MKLKYIFFLLFFTSYIFGQNYFLPKGVFNDSIELYKFIRKNILIQNKDFVVSHDIDSLKTKIVQEITLDQYSKAIEYIYKYRNELAINNWEGNKLFSLEVYSKAKILEENKDLNFSNALQETLSDKIQNLPESLLIKLKSEISIDISELSNNRNLIYYELKDKVSINSEELTSLANVMLEYTVTNFVNKKALEILDKTISEKFNIETTNIGINQAILTVTTFRKRAIKNPQPGILYNNIYAGEKDYMVGLRAANRDYVGIVVNVRGKRNSKDIIEPFEHESTDLYEVIDWISKQKWCNGKVGMIGGSYLGFSQWAATKKMHPALKTIVPQVAVGIGAMDFPMKNNMFSSNILPWICYVTNNNLEDEKDYNDDDKWLSIFTTYYKKGLKFRDLDSLNGKRNVIFQRWLDHPKQDEYWQKMAPYKEDFSKINIPILTTTGFFDADQRGALYYFKEHYKYNKKAQHYLVIGPYDHSMGQNFAKNEVYGYKMDSVAKINITDLSYDWFDYILRGARKPDLLKNKVNIQVMGANTWSHYSTIEKATNKDLKLYLTNKSKKVFEKPKNKGFYNQIVDFKVREYKKRFYSTGKDSISISPHANIIESELLTKDIIINGSFTGNLNVSINKKDFDISIDLVEIDPNGKILELSDYVGRASYSKDKSVRNLLTPNAIEKLPINNSSYVARKVKKGSKLVILYGVKFNKIWQVNYGTGKDVSDETMAEDAKEPLIIKWFNDSYISIPILEK